MDTILDNDEDLLEHLRSGNEYALSRIHSLYWKSLFYSAYKVLGDTAAAQDVVQEIFISLWERRASADIRSLKAYLHRAVYFQVLNRIRSSRIDRRMVERLSSASVNILRNQPQLFYEAKDIYQKVMESLKPELRELFRMNREDGMTYQQIANKKGISVKTVEKKISLGLRSIRVGFNEALILIVAFLLG